MRKQLFLSIALLILLAGSGFAANTPPQVFDVNVITPATGSTFYPNLVGKCIDFNFQVFDSNAGAPGHYANIYLDYGDANTSLATDVNLDSTNCSFHGVSNVWTTGADCHIKWCVSTKIPNNTYAVDVNIANKWPGGQRDLNAMQVLTLTVNNRFIDTSTQAILNLLPIAMALVVILFVVLGMMGIVGMDMVTKVLPLALAVMVGIVILTQVLQILLGV